MRNSILIILVGLILTAEALAAHADNAGPIKQPTVGTANPSPDSAATDLGTPPPKPATGGDAAPGNTGSLVDKQTAVPRPGADTSTAAPGGHAESTANGALSSPADDQSNRLGKKTGEDTNGTVPM
jgi:hypothetical protein